MSIVTDKEKIIKRLKDTNEEWVIKSIKKLLDVPEEDDDEIIGYVGEEPYTKYQLRKDAQLAEEEDKNGQYTSSADLKKEIKKWGKKN